ncbi:MAG: LysR family transcriptional regulator [Stackebrandtia sp.]
MDLQQMRYVVAVAEAGSFTHAARRCHVVQSALSHQIARLEHELGARLFHRTSRRVRLTSEGESFLPAARQCLAAADRARAEVAAASGEVRGRLLIGAIRTVTAIDLPEALGRFHKRHPRVSIGLRTAASKELTTQVRNGEIDVAFLGLSPTARPTGVRAHELEREELVAVVAPEHPLAAESSVDLQRLAEETFVDFPAGTAARAQTDDAFADAGLTRRVEFEVSTPELTAGLVRQKLGITMLPIGYAASLPGLATINISDEPHRVQHLIWSKLGPAPAATAFLRELGVPDTTITGPPRV